MVVISAIKNQNALMQNNIANCNIAVLNIRIFWKILPIHTYTDFLTSPETHYKFEGSHGLNNSKSKLSFYIKL